MNKHIINKIHEDHNKSNRSILMCLKCKKMWIRGETCETGYFTNHMERCDKVLAANICNISDNDYKMRELLK